MSRRTTGEPVPFLETQIGSIGVTLLCDPSALDASTPLPVPSEPTRPKRADECPSCLGCGTCTVAGLRVTCRRCLGRGWTMPKNGGAR